MIERIGYLISSHRDYRVPLARLLYSMQAIDPADILIVAGGFAQPLVMTDRQGRRRIEVTHNSYDYTALIGLLDNPDMWSAPDHLFLLHDTMELGPQSDTLIRQANPAHLATAAWGGECNLALYRLDYLQQRAQDILKLSNCTKLQAVQAEGFLWRSLPESERGGYPGACDVGVVRRTYGGTERSVCHYRGVDVTKYKANWGQNMKAMAVQP